MFGVHLLESYVVFRDIKRIVPKGKFMSNKSRKIEGDLKNNSMKISDSKQLFDTSD